MILEGEEKGDSVDSRATRETPETKAKKVNISVRRGKQWVSLYFLLLNFHELSYYVEFILCREKIHMGY